jgi:hypothetical protein
MGETVKAYRTEVSDCRFQCKVTAIGEKVNGKFKVDVYVNNTEKTWDGSGNMYEMASDIAMTDSASRHILKHLYNVNTTEADGTWSFLPSAFTTGSIDTFASTLETNIESSVKIILGNPDGVGVDTQKLVGSVWGQLDIDNDNDIVWYPTEDFTATGDDFTAADITESKKLALEIAKAYSIQDSGEPGQTTSLGTNINNSFDNALAQQDGTSDFLNGDKMTVNLKVNANVNIGSVTSYDDMVIAFV